MKRCLLPVIAFVSLLSPGMQEAHADWAALGWDHCGSRILSRQFACDTNAGDSRLVVSAMRDEVPVFTDGFRCVLEVAVDSPTLPAWWLVKSGDCRAGALTANDLVVPEDFVQCAYPWSLLGTIVAVDHSSPSRLRVTLTGFSPSGDNSMSPDVESFIIVASISHQKTMGAGTCVGCDVPACVMLRELTMIDGFPTFALVPIAIQEPTFLLGWQSTRSNCMAVPVRNSTWGRLKALYR